MQLAIAMSAAFFALGDGTTVVSQDSCRLSPLYVPQMSRMIPKYRAPTLRVLMRILHPAAEMIMGMIICQVESWYLPHDQAAAQAKA